MSKLTYFEKWWLDAWPHRWHIRSFVPRFLRACPDPFRGEVLEIGSGAGWSSRRILETFPQVALTATDVDGATASNFEKLGKVYGQRLKFRQADVRELPFDRESYDIVVAIHAMHHVDDLPQAIRQLLRVLRPGGLIGFTDDNPTYMRGPVKWLFPASSFPSREVMEEILRDEGCELITTQGKLHYYLWARKPFPI